MMDKKSFGWEIKGIDETGYIEGVAAGYGNVDFGNDKILPGAFTKSLNGRTGVPMLLFHDQQRPVGKWHEFSESDSGLLVKGKISTKTRDGGEAYELAKDGALSALSIGYESLKHKMAGKVRELHELLLHEVSLVAIGMNNAALITGVKDIMQDGALPSLSQFEDFLREAGFSKSQATAIAGNGLSHLHRSESGDVTEDDIWAAMSGADVVDLTGE